MLTRPIVVLSPERPHHDAGSRTEPPVSVPIAHGAMPDATATPEPLLDPPGVRGTSGRVAEGTSLGWFRVADLLPGTDGKARVTMVFRVSDGAVGLAAVDLKTGRSFRVEPVEPPPAPPPPSGRPPAG